jgi:UDP-GlcNAc:undecaprenyl-phosphate GlcNAc-1-phosphate transferase
MLVISVSYLFFPLNDGSLRFGAGNWLNVDKHLIGIWLGGALIVVSMLLDDIRGLKAWQKLIFQIISVLIIIAAGVGIDRLSLPFGGSIDLNSVYIPIFSLHGITYHFSLWSDLLTLLWLIGMMNV